MSEHKVRADEIEQAKAQQKAQALHMRLMEAPATFAPSFYLADASGMIRLIMHEPGANNEPMVRGSFITTPEALLKLAEIGPQFVAQMRAAQAAAIQQAEVIKAAMTNGHDPNPAPEIQKVDGGEASVATAAPVPETVN
jgi:hypothetical protein